jgi:hypothetical protein
MSRPVATELRAPCHPLARSPAPVFNSTNAKRRKNAKNFLFRMTTLRTLVRANPFLSQPSTDVRMPHANSLLGVSIPTSHRAKRDPFFSITYTFFLIRNFAHLFSFVTTTNSLPKAPLSSQKILRQSFSNQIFGSSNSDHLAPMGVIASKNVPTNTFRICLFHKRAGMGPPQSPRSPPFGNLRIRYRTKTSPLALAPRPYLLACFRSRLFVPRAYALLLQLACAKMLHQSAAAEMHQL